MAVNKVLVIGAGVGGLAAAAALGQRGVAVDVVEVREDEHVLGVGINQPGNSLRALDALGVLEDVLAVGFPYDGNDYRDWNDERIVLVPSSLGDGRVPANCALTRKELHTILHAAADAAGASVTYGVTVEALEERDDSVAVTLSNGDVGVYDLVVAFDGVRSPMRRRLFGDAFEPVHTGSSVWRLQLPRPADVTRTTLWQGDLVKGGVIPLSAESMYMLLVTREPGNPRHAPEDFGELLRERLAGFSGLLADIRESITSSQGIVYSPLVEVQVPLPWHKGRVIVLGDAVHTAVPHLTQGAGMALEDAVVLADEVTRDRPIEESLVAVEALRYPRVDLVFNASHAILEAEMQVTADAIPAAAAGMREHLPGQTAFVEGVLNQPFRAQADQAAVN
ncbi:FAD-dependent monooxygenase [Georgenia sp. AZ-5]|uniref:FAD-dependent monooxygenase n=1 Tax=Georgenia sp. AZ-5 TaxID=3367526 RepID=UPI0037554086